MGTHPMLFCFEFYNANAEKVGEYYDALPLVSGEIVQFPNGLDWRVIGFGRFYRRNSIRYVVYVERAWT